MNLAEYKQLLAAIPYGKRLPSALYLYRDEPLQLGDAIETLVQRAAISCGATQLYNVLKFRLDELKVSFLAYPDFLDDPHPALRHAITIDLTTGKHRETDYAGNINPPILHRKEAFVPHNHPKRAQFAALTQAEEAHGLYENSATIGFKLNWERLLAAKGLTVEGQSLRPIDIAGPEDMPLPVTRGIDRHKTALTRYDLSKPVKTLVEYGLLKTGTTFFDYGCGQGSDVNGLRALGYAASGWDPVHKPDGLKQMADVVNLGYVLNVIEDPAERLDSLVDAYRHAERLLVVSGLIQQTNQALPLATTPRRWRYSRLRGTLRR
ncbi:MAG: DNA phosphorothioation-associated putative methyltransferase [Verrucomicrobia bacterium]|nr:DNA phosphorothioation-associated putative methyltransferase [Verrucomicrobiota bacterium]